MEVINRLTDTFHLALTIHVVYHYTIELFGNLPAQVDMIWLAPSPSLGMFSNTFQIICSRSFKVSIYNTDQNAFTMCSYTSVANSYHRKFFTLVMAHVDRYFC